MNLNNYTIKSQEIIQKAQQLAFNNGNPNIETNHLLKALLDDEDSPVEFLLKKNNVNVSHVKAKAEEMIGKLPKVNGAEPAQSVSREFKAKFRTPIFNTLCINRRANQIFLFM
jgi:ATP-dependent Clp protease ATP-binding subunit ClpB